jgi:brefeldin A-inhibited guanine nucleotide-exchange protein
MFDDTSPERQGSKADVENALVPLCKDIIGGYIALEEESQHRNIVAWRPVVVDVLQGYSAFPQHAFSAHIPTFYPLVVELLGKELNDELRRALLPLLRRVGEVGLGIEGMTAGKRGSVAGPQRRQSILSAVSTEEALVSMDNASDDASTNRMVGR